MAAKGPDAFRTISEASEEVGVPSHVLRFWETKFSFIRPMKRSGGRRFYRPQDVAVLRGVRALLHDEGYTIKGVQKLQREQGTARLARVADGEAPGPDPAASEPDLDDASAADLAPGDADPSGAPPFQEASWTGAEESGSIEPDIDAEPDAEAEPDIELGANLEARASRFVLDAAARARLAAVLGDLERVKARIDALLGPS